MAQNFVGSNNLNLLQPIGQFGTRLHGGKDAASPRYIFTMMRYIIIILFMSKFFYSLFCALLNGFFLQVKVKFNNLFLCT